jgi:hypothetical protein
VALELPELVAEVVVGVGPPMKSEAPPVIGPGAVDAEAPIPTSAPSACYIVNEDIEESTDDERKIIIPQAFL